MVYKLKSTKRNDFFLLHLTSLYSFFILFWRIEPREEFEITDNHEKYPAYSRKIEISSNPKVGRHTVANDDIEPFETVLVEEPLAKVLYVEKSGFNCTHCLKRLKAAVPCRKCSGVAFCSVFCRDEAQETYHRWECPYQVLILWRLSQFTKFNWNLVRLGCVIWSRM